MRLKLRLEEVWEVLSKGMLSVVEGINGNDGFAFEVDGVAHIVCIWVSP